MRRISDTRRMCQIETLVRRLRMAELHNEDLRKRVMELRQANAALQEQVRALTKE